MLKKRFLQAIAIGLVLVYFGVALSGKFPEITGNAWSMAAFQLVFGLGVLPLFKHWEWKKIPFSLGAGVAFFFSLSAGFAVFEASGVLGYPVPFAVKDPQTVLFFIFLSPLLEEWIYRGALWKLIEKITRSPWPSFLVTAIAFSYAHYALTGNLKNIAFARYQAIYILGLGLFCGGLRIQFGWLAAMIAHLAFNFGFWLAAL